VEINEDGHAVVPPWEGLDLLKRKKLVRAIVRKEYGLYFATFVGKVDLGFFIAMVVPCKAVPWESLNRRGKDYFGLSCLPRGVKLSEPTKMREEAINNTLEHWCKRQQDGKVAFEFLESLRQTAGEEDGEATEGNEDSEEEASEVARDNAASQAEDFEDFEDSGDPTLGSGKHVGDKLDRAVGGDSGEDSEEEREDFGPQLNFAMSQGSPIPEESSAVSLWHSLSL
jgi:hypothetical protein